MEILILGQVQGQSSPVGNKVRKRGLIRKVDGDAGNPRSRESEVPDGFRMKEVLQKIKDSKEERGMRETVKRSCPVSGKVTVGKDRQALEEREISFSKVFRRVGKPGRVVEEPGSCHLRRRSE